MYLFTEMLSLQVENEEHLRFKNSLEITYLNLTLFPTPQIKKTAI